MSVSTAVTWMVFVWVAVRTILYRGTSLDHAGFLRGERVGLTLIQH